jgi:hypothetical protein
VTDTLRRSAWVLCAALACGDRLEPSVLGTATNAVVRGGPSSDDQNAVVLIVSESFGNWCTGTVVAPHLLLTARHCLFDSVLGENFFALCEGGVGAQVLGAPPPESFAVYFGKERPLDDPVAYGTDVYSTDDLDLCLNDIALLRVDTPLPVEPLAMRLDAPPIKGEIGTLVGWGVTQENETLADKRQQRELSVEEIGPNNYAPPGGPARAIGGTSFVASEGGCGGDSGAPLIAKATGAIIGVQYAVSSRDPVVELDEQNAFEQCLSAATLFQRLDQQAPWLRETFREAEAAPWLEGHAPPAPVATACSSHDDCLSGLCLEVAGTGFCSMRCETSECPEDMSCLGPADARACVPTALAASESAPADSCALRAPRRGGVWVVALVLATCSARRRLERRTMKGDAACKA